MVPSESSFVGIAITAYIRRHMCDVSKRGIRYMPSAQRCQMYECMWISMGP